MLTTLTVILLIAMFIVWKTVIIVPMREMCIVERLGKFRAVLEPLSHRRRGRRDHPKGRAGPHQVPRPCSPFITFPIAILHARSPHSPRVTTKALPKMPWSA